MRIPFHKLHALGNDFVLVDARPLRWEATWAAALADRRFGVGCDQVLVAEEPTNAAADLRMRIYNADGGEVEMCGNGLRAFAHWAWREGLVAADASVRVETQAGLRRATPTKDGIRVEMGSPTWGVEAVGGTGVAEAEPLWLPEWPAELRPGAIALAVGNPHLVFFVADVEAVPLESWGPLLERDPRFPARVNVEFVAVHAPDHLRVRVWERGAGATLACGTGATAAALAAIRTGRATAPVTVELPGGRLRIEWDGRSAALVGPATHVAEGTVDVVAIVRERSVQP